MRGYPIATAGMRIGLLGGSFDPPHLGHIHISKWALKSFGLDQVWWLVSPSNPLKSDAPADMERRLAAACAIVQHPRIVVTDIERRLGTYYTAQTLAVLQVNYNMVRFMWLMGADNLIGFHRWESWTDIMHMMPIGVLARPGQQVRAGKSFAALRFQWARLASRHSNALPFRPAPCWSMLTGKMVDISSTAIRKSGQWMR